MPQLILEAIESFKFSDSKKEKMFRNFVEANHPIMQVLGVYTFWLVAARWIQDTLSMTEAFLAEIKAEFNKVLLHLYWLYLNGVANKQRDTLMDFLLIFLAEIVREAFYLKVKNHLIKFKDEPVFIMLCKIIYQELYGHTPSKTYLHLLIKKNSKTFFDRLKIMKLSSFEPKSPNKPATSKSMTSNKQSKLASPRAFSTWDDPTSPVTNLRMASEGKLPTVG